MPLIRSLLDYMQGWWLVVMIGGLSPHVFVYFIFYFLFTSYTLIIKNNQSNFLNLTQLSHPSCSLADRLGNFCNCFVISDLPRKALHFLRDIWDSQQAVSS